jgi:hypothetical protein
MSFNETFYPTNFYETWGGLGAADPMQCPPGFVPPPEGWAGPQRCIPAGSAGVTVFTKGSGVTKCYDSSGKKIVCPDLTDPTNCPSGQTWDSTAMVCKVPGVNCDAGLVMDPTTGQCVPVSQQCPAGTVWDPNVGACRGNPPPGVPTAPVMCNPGFFWDVASMSCLSLDRPPSAPLPGGGVGPVAGRPGAAPPPAPAPASSGISGTLSSITGFFSAHLVLILVIGAAVYVMKGKK